jgi:hypothetical protein
MPFQSDKVLQVRVKALAMNNSITTSAKLLVDSAL